MAKDKEEKTYVKLFSGKKTDWQAWKARFYARVSKEKDVKSVNLLKVLQGVESNVNDENKWDVSNDEAESIAHRLIIEKLDDANTIVLSGPRYLGQGKKSWQRLLHKYEDTKGEDGGISILTCLMSEKLGEEEYSKFDEFRARFELNVAKYESVEGKPMGQAIKIAFLGKAIPDNEDWTLTKSELSKSKTIEDALDFCEKKAKRLDSQLNDSTLSTLSVTSHNSNSYRGRGRGRGGRGRGRGKEGGSCWSCGSTDHYAYKCPEKSAKIECHACGETGHTKYECSEIINAMNAVKEKKEKEKKITPTTTNRQLEEIMKVVKNLEKRNGEDTSCLEEEAKAQQLTNTTTEKQLSAKDKNRNKVSFIYKQLNLIKGEGSIYEANKKKEISLECVIDSGGCRHSMTDKRPFIKMRPSSVVFVSFKKSELKARGEGKIDTYVKDLHGGLLEFKLDEVCFTPEATANIVIPQQMELVGWDTREFLRGGYMINPQGRKVKVRKNKYGQPVMDLIIKEKGCGTLINIIRKNKECNLKEIRATHEKLGHINVTEVCKILGMKRPEKFLCDVCQLCKITKRKINKSRKHGAKEALEKVHIDIMGPYTPVGKRGRKYVMGYTDDFTGVKKFYSIQKKSQAVDTLHRYITEMGKPMSIRGDNAKEFLQGEFKRVCLENHIRTEWSAPYTPQQNGKAERSNRTVMDMVRCMVKDANLPKVLWPYALKHAEQILNCLPRAVLKNRNGKRYISHIDLWNMESEKGRVIKQKERLSDNHLMKWGHRYAVLREGTNRGKKLEPKGEECYYLGEDWSRGAKIFLAKDRNGISVSRNSRKLEMKEEEPTIKIEKSTRDEMLNVTDESTEENTESATQEDVEEVQDIENAEGNVGIQGANIDSSNDTEPDSDDEGKGQGSICTVDSKNLVKHRLRKITKVLTSVAMEPKSFQEAVTGQDKEKWIEAITEELKTLVDMGTFRKVKKEEWMNILRLKHVFKQKKDENGKIIRFKDRCVVQGCKQVKGIDYFKTRSNVIRKETFRFLCNMTVKSNAKMYQADIKNAYPLSLLDELIFCDEPDGVKFLDEARRSLIELGDDEILQLLRSLYGLKQAGRNWEKMLRAELKKRGFVPCKADPCLYINKENIRKGEGVMAVGTYVDDLPVVATTPEDYQTFIKSMAEDLPIVNLGEAKWFLSVEIIQENGSIKLSQLREVENVYEMVKGELPMKSRSTPMESKIYRIEEQSTAEGVDQDRYRSLTGSLLYISEWTRPDLAFSTSYLCTKLGKATKTDVKYLHRVIKFMYDTKDRVVEYKKREDLTQTILVGWTDSDWANDPKDRRSVIGHLVFVDGNLCSWKSSKQKQGRALSSTEAEYIALSEGVRESKYIRHLIEECYGKRVVTEMKCDSTGAISNAENEMQHKRTKHIDVRHHFIKDEVDRGLVNIGYVNTKLNLADLMTKPVEKGVYEKLIDGLLSRY
jgi:hypothetical protein